jgi:hypothetical protein
VAERGDGSCERLDHVLLDSDVDVHGERLATVRCDHVDRIRVVVLVPAPDHDGRTR